MNLIYKDTLLANHVVFYRNPLLRFLGLRFSRKLRKGDVIVLVASRESIHSSSIDMFFVFFPIDVLWLNSRYEIVDFRTNVKPFTPFIKPQSGAKFVIELPEGSLKDVVIGEKVSFTETKVF